MWNPHLDTEVDKLPLLTSLQDTEVELFLHSKLT